MKEKEGLVDCPDQQMILYVEKEGGIYGPVQTGSYLTANYLDDFFLKRRNLEADLRDQVLRGVITPIRYYMVLEELTMQELAARAGIRKSKVKKHLDPSQFGNVTVEELRRYATVFNVPIANLLQCLVVNIDHTDESTMLLEKNTGKLSISQEQQGNPYVTLTKIGERI